MQGKYTKTKKNKALYYISKTSQINHRKGKHIQGKCHKKVRAKKKDDHKTKRMKRKQQIKNAKGQERGKKLKFPVLEQHTKHKTNATTIHNTATTHYIPD